jgi:phage FluMu protein Com
MRTGATEVLQSYRCPGCGKLLFKGTLIISTVQVKCKKCGTLATFNCLDDVNDTDQFSLLIDKTGTVVSTGLYKEAFCGPQRNLIGTKLSSLLHLMGDTEKYDEIISTAEHPDFSKTYSDTVNSAQHPLSVQWNFIRRNNVVYIYVLLDRRTSTYSAMNNISEIEKLPATIRAASLT